MYYVEKRYLFFFHGLARKCLTLTKGKRTACRAQTGLLYISIYIIKKKIKNQRQHFIIYTKYACLFVFKCVYRERVEKIIQLRVCVCVYFREF